MNSYKLAKSLGFNSHEELFNYMVESYINGNLSQCKELFSKLSKVDKKLCLNYIIAHHEYNDVYKFYFNLL